MDRLTRPLVACGLGLLVASTGCRSTRTEVPPGRPFGRDGQQKKAIDFSSEGHPVSAAASNNFMPSNLGGSGMASGIGSSGGRPDGSAMGGPPGAYGPPGTAGMGEPGTGDAATTRASGGSMGTPPPGVPPLDMPAPSGSPTATDLDVGRPRDAQPMPMPMPSQTVQPTNDSPGTMGTPDQPPSPN